MKPVKVGETYSAKSLPFVGASRKRASKRLPLTFLMDELQATDLCDIAKDVRRPRGTILRRSHLSKLARMSTFDQANLEPHEIIEPWRQLTALMIDHGRKQPIPHYWTRLQLEWGIDRLRDLAIGGDEAAMSAYGSFVWRLVYDLESLSRTHPEVVSRWSRKCTEVPILAGNGPHEYEYIRQKLEKFAVGEEGDCRMRRVGKGRGMLRDSVANRIVSEIVSRMNLYRSLGALFGGDSKLAREIATLPAYSNRTAERWAAVGWEWIMVVTERKPEAVIELRKLGEKAGEKSLTEKSSESLIRSKIREVLGNSFKGMAPPTADT